MAGIGKQKDYSESSAPSVGHLGNCLCLAGLHRAKGTTSKLASRSFSGKKLPPFCPLKHLERISDSDALKLFKISDPSMSHGTL